ncbi:HDOD domain-containing protein [Dissulfurimicrobium hydrothermale]|uniref:HDOD domain-containing protein n=1 Tax=Dissulfurimicrobium hydrothermale TaxID=1750598 RepID=UPI001EDAA86B|nr:HDOD domain-containing protein [Dissulfurimicrobium hydrothermale]UKL13606.1 HDOD domain-containing protein [Dissulfurimicrobium hydrothermale]
MDKQDQGQKRQDIRHRLRYIKSLPTLPPIASMLNKMVEDEEMTASRLGSVIEKDQVLTSKLLKMVNSSFFGFPQRIGAVSNAIVLLGFNVIKTLIVTSSIFDVMQSSDVGLWEHSLGCATAAGIFAKRHGLKNPEEVSTAGLIHDLGKVVIRAEFTKEYEEIQNMVKERGISMREAELECLGVAHPEIGGWLIKQWNLPDRLILPVIYHHNPEDATDFRDIAAIVHFSDILIRAVGFGSGGDKWVPPLDHKAWERIKMGKGEMKEVLNELDEKIIELKDFTLRMQQTKGGAGE